MVETIPHLLGSLGKGLTLGLNFIKSTMPSNLRWNFFFFFFLGLHLRHMEVPMLGVKSELQLTAYTAAHGNAGSLTH